MATSRPDGPDVIPLRYRARRRPTPAIPGPVRGRRGKLLAVDHTTTPLTTQEVAWRPVGQGPGLAKGRRALAAHVARRRLRVAPWQGDPYIALIGPAASGRSPRSDEIRQSIRALDERGVVRAVTPALSAFEAEPFFQAGFRLFERLHLLSCSLADIDTTRPPRAERPVARSLRGRRWHNQAVLEVDAKAFDGFWRFDERALREAKSATPSSRFRVAKIGSRVVGYAVTGRAGSRGYLQRLAVNPDVQGRGIGSMLIRDSFRWLKQRRATLSLVNTQETNTNALRLYEHHGYRRQPEGLFVLRWDKVT